MAPEISTKAETRPDERLTGDKVQRIVDAYPDTALAAAL